MQMNNKETPSSNIFDTMEERQLFSRIRDDILTSRTGIRLEELQEQKDREKFLSTVNDYIRRVYRIREEKIKRFDEYIVNAIFHYDVLTELMEDEEISDIKVLAWDRVRIKRNGIRSTADVKFWGTDYFRGFVEMLAVRNGVNTGTLNAIQTFTDKRSSDRFIYRYNISTATVNSTEEPYLHIRKIPKEKYSLDKLVKLQMMPRGVSQYLVRRMQEGYMVICGKNGSGKTYLLNALLDELPHGNSVLVVQENEELFSDTHPDMMFQRIAVRKGEKKVNYSLKELVVNGLLIDTDYIIIGEIKGEEALYFISAALSGSNGITTIHSVDAKGALDKLADYCKWASDYSREDIFKMLSCVSTLVYVEDFQVKEIAVNHGWDAEASGNRIDVVYDSGKGVYRLR